MTAKRTDFRALKARRDAGLRRPELSRPAKPVPVDPAAIAGAMADGRYQKLPPKPRR